MLKVYGLPPALALDVASSHLLTIARLSLADKQLEAMQAKVYLKILKIASGAEKSKNANWKKLIAFFEASKYTSESTLTHSHDSHYVLCFNINHSSSYL